MPPGGSTGHLVGAGVEAVRQELELLDGENLRGQLDETQGAVGLEGPDVEEARLPPSHQQTAIPVRGTTVLGGVVS